MPTKRILNVKHHLDTIIQQAQKGSQAAYKILYGELIPVIKGTIRGKIFGVDSCSVEDIAHDVFIKIFLKLNTFSPGRDFNSWAISIARNHCVDLSRKKKVGLIYNNFRLQEQRLNFIEEKNPERQLIEKENIVDLEVFIKSNLKMEKQNIILNKYLKNLKQKEIAIKEGLPIGSVSSIQHSALGILRKQAERLKIRASDFS